MISIHDNHIYKYIVDYDKKIIELYTESESKIKEYIIVRFEDWIAYHFINADSVSITYSIEEIDYEAIIKNDSYYFSQTHFIPGLNNDVEKLKNKIKKEKLKCFEIYSSVGLNGWIVAKR